MRLQHLLSLALVIPLCACPLARHAAPAQPTPDVRWGEWQHAAELPALEPLLKQLAATARTASSSLTPSLPLAELAAQFYATDNPLADAALLCELLPSTPASCDALAQQLPQATPGQAAALAVLAEAARTPQAAVPGGSALADAVLREMQHQPRPAYAAALALWLGRGDGELAAQLAGLLARCGGDIAREALTRVYTAHTYSQRKALIPPYAFPPADASALQFAGPVALPGAGQLVACCAPGLISPDDIYLGLSPASAPDCYEILYTGLNNFNHITMYPGGRQRLPGADKALALSATGSGCTLWHYIARPAAPGTPGGGSATKYGAPVVQYATSSLAYADLRRDSDGDGLPDTVESALLLAPDRTDTDGDGTPDGLDALPNLDAASLNAVERGIQRALLCWRGLGPARAAPRSLPWDAMYYISDDGLHVAAALQPWSYGITVSGAQAGARYHELLGGSDSSRGVWLTLTDLRGATPAPAAQAAQPGALRLPRFDFSTPQSWADDPGTPPGTRYVVQLNCAGERDAAYLGELDGELFPLAVSPVADF